ncbi:MAG: cob(I)yrinic acid a,c-diamide adenosyltransferase [Prevotella sp.]|jgi:ATP:cob(I)alamin adenosyltransferase|nr:cob(I)yrinic acid a,c-diamide adenosyltransferase [Prevotella sp.]MBP6528329.1 cob(I)yrinic acid a,c-diamide adenosyltransferase [Prevotella sp.]MBP8686590.1 cob(I)yrinic acid a,c-diamide adenosyltransferase [Prevotella sp.]
MKIYTKTGDKGFTSLKNEAHVEKDDVRIEANGALDELNASFGVVKAYIDDSDAKQKIELFQNIIMRIMGVVAGAEMDSKFDLESITVQIEHDIDENKNEGKFCFVMPGESILNAYLHVARTKCRTAERRLITMRHHYAIADNIMAFINRLSDWLFVEATKK